MSRNHVLLRRRRRRARRRRQEEHWTRQLLKKLFTVRPDGTTLHDDGVAAARAVRP